MANYSNILIKKYFEENSFVKSDIENFNHFIEHELQKIIEENREVEPTIIPPNVESLKIRLDKIWVTKPEITEADGSKRAIFPIEARLRKISYAAPLFIEVSSHINDVQRETLSTQIGSLPIMLKSNNCHLHKLSREEIMAKACKACNRISVTNVCPNCSGTDLSNRFQGMVIIIDPNKSDIAKKMQVNIPGEYALEVL